MNTNSGFNAEAVSEHIIAWLKSYATNAKMKGFVVGISGGIDSAVTSTLCAKTGLPTLCVEMPIHQAKNQVDRAQEHIKALKKQYSNVSEQVVDLTPVFTTFEKQVPSSDDNSILNLALANTRARLRMTTLYYIAGLNHALVAGTGNKVEDFGVGFYTKYGDGGVDLSPIADLMKSEVRELGKYLQVPQSIIEAKPTDGLFGDDRTDEDQLGATYEELEWAMYEDEKGRVINDFEERNKEVFTIYKRLNTANQHKMNPIPICEIPKKLK